MHIAAVTLEVGTGGVIVEPDTAFPIAVPEGRSTDGTAVPAWPGRESFSPKSSPLAGRRRKPEHPAT